MNETDMPTETYNAAAPADPTPHPVVPAEAQASTQPGPPPAYAPGGGSPTTGYTPVVAKSPKKYLWIGLAAGFAGGLLVSGLIAGIGSAIAAASVSTVLPKAVDTCSARDKSGISLGDKDTSLTVDTEGKDDTTGAAMEDLVCIVKELKVPDSVVAQMDSTTSLQGRQSAEWEDLKASWTYHPDSGMKLIVTVAKK